MANSLFFQGTTEEEAKHIIELINDQLRNIDNTLHPTKWDFNAPLQQINYGAPGTGKSHGTEGEIEKIYPNKEERKLNVFRTTFHPDSDYSTFVGCYKPIQEKNTLLDMGNVSETLLVKKLKEYTSDETLGIVGGLQKFSIEFAEYLLNYTNSKYRDILNTAGLSDKYDVEISKYLKLYKNLIKPNLRSSSAITYKFVPQAFTKAFIHAYELLEENKPVFLVIEEINRGNCAQIFGDLFQLLDREDDGYSKYAIKPDTDLENYLVEKLGDKYDVDEGMKLPPNLYIWATMNTSDQSLFPIDSAFKRRWDWKYIPIDTEKENWAIEVNGSKYSWTRFLEIINDKILYKTQSEDKQLGFYFCKAENGVIYADKFVSKILFFIYNDVYKDYGFDDDFFKDEKDDNNKVLSFRKYYDKGGNVIESQVEKFLKNLKVEIVSNDSKHYYSLNGEGKYMKAEIWEPLFDLYSKKYPDETPAQIRDKWSNSLEIPFDRTIILDENDKSPTITYIEITYNNNIFYYDKYWTEDIFNKFVKNINATDWGIQIKEV